MRGTGAAADGAVLAAAAGRRAVAALWCSVRVGAGEAGAGGDGCSAVSRGDSIDMPCWRGNDEYRLISAGGGYLQRGTEVVNADQ